MSTHTPGPWNSRWSATYKDVQEVIAAHGQGVIQIIASQIYDAPNARLIAAAPDLLDALQEIAAAPDCLCCYRTIARSAIAKLEGK